MHYVKPTVQTNKQTKKPTKESRRTVVVNQFCGS